MLVDLSILNLTNFTLFSTNYVCLFVRIYSLNNLAATYTNSEQYELAIESYEASVKDRTESLGADHEDTLYTIKILDIVRYKLAHKTTATTNPLSQTGKRDKNSVKNSVNKGINTSQNTTDIIVTDEGEEDEETGNATASAALNLFKTEDDIARESTVTSTSGAGGEGDGEGEGRPRLLTIRYVCILL